MDDLRLLLMREPRGHSAMSGAILQPPTRDDADCRRAVHRGVRAAADVRARDDRRRHRAGRDRPRRGDRAGDRGAARHAGRPGRGARAGRRRPRDQRDAAQRARRSCYERERRAADVVCDIAFGGNFYALGAGRATSTRRARTSTSRRGAEIMAAINEDPPVHPEDARIAGCRHVVFHAPGRDGADARNATSIHPGWLDRSPCGTGTSARMAQLHANGELAIGQPFVNESVIGTRFTGRLVGETTVGRVRGRDPGDHRPRVDHRHGRVPARRRRSVPRRLRAVNPDVVVVGAGIVGVCAALRACARGRVGHACWSAVRAGARSARGATPGCWSRATRGRSRRPRTCAPGCAGWCGATRRSGCGRSRRWCRGCCATRGLRPPARAAAGRDAAAIAERRRARRGSTSSRPRGSTAATAAAGCSPCTAPSSHATEEAESETGRALGAAAADSRRGARARAGPDRAAAGRGPVPGRGAVRPDPAGRRRRRRRAAGGRGVPLGRGRARRGAGAGRRARRRPARRPRGDRRGRVVGRAGRVARVPGCRWWPARATPSTTSRRRCGCRSTSTTRAASRTR